MGGLVRNIIEEIKKSREDMRKTLDESLGITA